MGPAHTTRPGGHSDAPPEKLCGSSMLGGGEKGGRRWRGLQNTNEDCPLTAWGEALWPEVSVLGQLGRLLLGSCSSRSLWFGHRLSAGSRSISPSRSKERGRWR